MANQPHFQKKNLKASFRIAAFVSALAITTFAQERGPVTTSAADIRAAIDQLAEIDYPTRVKAARLIRRSEPAQAVAALLQAINEHKDGFVRFRSLVLLTGFNDPRAADEMREALA